MKKLIFAIVIGLVASGAFAQSVHYSPAGTPQHALRIWNGYPGDLVFDLKTGGTQIVATVDSVANTIVVSTNMKMFVTAITGTTNRTGNAKLIVDTSYSLDGDNPAANLVTGVTTTKPNSWLYLDWDLAKTKTYQIAVPSRDTLRTKDGDIITEDMLPSVSFKIARVYGQPSGTGDVSVLVYIDGKEKYTKLVGDTTNNVVNISEELGFPVGAQQNAIIRFKRASTAFGGNIGFIAE